MRSHAAVEVAKEVLETIGKGERPILQKIMEKKGYSKATARGNAKQVTESLSYKSVMNPVIKALEEEREAIIERLKVTRSKAKYRDLTDGLDKITKNIQLLSGGKTSNDAVQISWE